MSYYGYICKVKNIRPANNSDNLNLCDVFTNTVVVDKSYNENDVYVYFPVDGQLSEEFCKVNNLVRLYDEEGHAIPGGGYLDPDKRNIKAISLRGNKSDGLILPISCLNYCFDDDATAYLNVGDRIDVVNSHEICTKYIPKRQKKIGQPTNGNHTRKKKDPIAPLFAEHADTEQLAYNLGAFQPGDEVEITLKVHGTSQRTGYLPKLVGYKRTLWDKLLGRDGTPVYDYGYVTGTRRVVLTGFEDGGFYGSNAFREIHAKTFEGKLWKGEEVFYEVVGYANNCPIMADGDVPKEYQSQYGKIMEFSYGCSPTGYYTYEDGSHEQLPQSDIYVYRMTMTSPDGEVVEYPPDFMRYRCEQMGVKCVPVLWRGIIPENTGCEEDYTITAGEWIQKVAERFYDGPDPIGKTHVREGVVIRITNKPKFCAYKHKNWLFKSVAGIAIEKVNTENLSDDILSEM